MRAALIALLAAMIGGPALAQPSPEPVSGTDARRMAPAALHERVLDQFGDMLIVPSTKAPGGRATRPLDRLTYATRPRATEVSGVCRSDLVTFLFEPADPTLDIQPGDIPMKVYGVETRPAFRSLRPLGPARSDNPDLLRDRYDCAGLTDQAERFVFTAAADVATYAMAVRLLGTAQARAGLPGGPALECALHNPGSPPDCRKVLTAFNPNSATMIIPCAPKPAGGGNVCLRLDALTTAVEITRDSAGRIVNVNVREEDIVQSQPMG